MNAATPDGAPPWRIATKKHPLPAVPRRGHEAGVLRVKYDFHGSGLNRINSSQFLLSRFLNFLCKKGTLQNPFLKKNLEYVWFSPPVKNVGRVFSLM